MPFFLSATAFFYIAWNGFYGYQWHCSHCKTAIWLKNAVALKKNRTVWMGLKWCRGWWCIHGENIIQIKFWKERCHIVDLTSNCSVKGFSQNRLFTSWLSFWYDSLIYQTGYPNVLIGTVQKQKFLSCWIRAYSHRASASALTLAWML